MSQSQRGPAAFPDRVLAAVARAQAVCCLLLALFAHALPARAEGDAPACAGSAPPSAAYQVTVCLVQPAAGAQMSGVVQVSATVSVTGADPGVQRVTFRLDDGQLLTDYEAPYTFQLPSASLVDGRRTLTVDATMRDGFTAAQAAVALTFKNGTAAPPPPTGSFTPHTVGKLGRPIVVAATGDGAGGEAASAALTAQVKAADPDLFLYLGDVYSEGTYTEFYNWYGTADRFFGQFRDITNPVVGNHEYVTANAYGYFRYWNNIPHYYSYGVGDWRFIALDSNSQFGQTGPTTAQFEWLERELSASPAQCTLVYFHHPRYSIGPQGDAGSLDGMWRLMAAQGVDLVLAGHEHSYQRWQPLDGAGQPHSAGMTQFVVGTGGHGIQRFMREDARVAAGLDTPGASVGTLYLYLQAGRADYRFVNTAGAVLDQGSVTCSGEPPRTTYLPLVQR